MINRMKSILFTLLLSVSLPPLWAQEGTEPSGTSFFFRFVPRNNVFYVPYRGNGAELERLLDSIRVYSREIASGQMYLGVSCYAPGRTPAPCRRRDGAGLLPSLRPCPAREPAALGDAHARPRRGMAHRPQLGRSGKRRMDFMELGQQEPPLRLLESIARSALLYR